MLKEQRRIEKLRKKKEKEQKRLEKMEKTAKKKGSRVVREDKEKERDDVDYEKASGYSS